MALHRLRLRSDRPAGPRRHRPGGAAAPAAPRSSADHNRAHRALGRPQLPPAARGPRRARGPGSPTTRDGATSTAWPPTRRSTSGTAIPRLVDGRARQLDRLTLTSRAFHNELLGPFCRDLAGLASSRWSCP